MTLTANRSIVHQQDQERREFEVAAAAHIYADSLVGLHPVLGYAKPFEPCDNFVGIADAEYNNTDGSAGDTTGSSTKQGLAKVYVQGDFQHTLTGVGVGDAGKAVYATDDETLSLSGHPDGFVGRVVHKFAANKAVIRIKQPGELPGPADTGSIELVADGHELFIATGATAGTLAGPKGFLVTSALGLGVSPTAGAGGGIDGEFDATAEIAHATIETGDIFKVSGGIKFEMKGRISDIGDIADKLDIDWGFGTLPVAASRADMDNAAMVQLACFHLDGNVADILCQSDNNSSDVAPANSTIDNSLTVDKEFVIVVRVDGSVEFYIDGARVLSGTTFALLSTAAVAAFLIMEKVSDNTTAKWLLDRMRVTGART